jgi:DNA polymerase I
MYLVSFDCETHLSQPGLAAPPIVCGSLADDSGCHLLTRGDALTRLRALLANPLAHVVGVNLVYDLVCSAAAEPSLLPLIFRALEAGRVHDVAIREALIDIAKGELVDHGDEGLGQRYGMRILAERYLGLDLTDEKKAPDAWRKRYAELEDVPQGDWPWPAKRYPMRDVAFPLEIFKRQEGGPNLHQEAHEVRSAFALELIRVWGVRSNGAAVAALRARVEEEDRKNTIAFQALDILREDGTENKARLAELVTKAYDGTPPRTAPTGRYPQGQVSSDRDTLTESGDPALERYGRAGKNDKYLTTYLPILEQGVDQPWNPQFNVLVATTRVSSDAQQFPQKGGVRECWEARPGTVFCSVDYSGGELRTMAQRAINVLGFSRMAEVLNSGQDPHLIAAASFMGIEYRDAVARYAAGDPLVKVFRDLGKIWNFGKGGGMGPAAMVYNARKGKGETTKGPDGKVYEGSRFCLLAKRADRCGETKVTAKVQKKDRRICSVCLEVAKELDAGWLKAWPEQAELFAMASKLTKESRNVSVEIPGCGIKRGKVGYTQWLNTPFQGMLAVATKRAMWRCLREMYHVPTSPLFGHHMVLNVHDELIAELNEATAPEAAERMALIMREELIAVVPDLAASVEAEPALSRTMTKGAKTLRDERGRLTVFNG